MVGLGACRLFCGLAFGGGNVSVLDRGGRRTEGIRLTGNITHLMITEHRFAPFVTRHVRHSVLLPWDIPPARGKLMYALSLLHTGVFFVERQRGAMGK